MVRCKYSYVDLLYLNLLSNILISPYCIGMKRFTTLHNKMEILIPILLPTYIKMKKCAIYCWQHNKLYEIFEYNEDTVTLKQLIIWLKTNFYTLFRSKNTTKIYYLNNINNYENKYKIKDDSTLRLCLNLVLTGLSESNIYVSFSEVK